MTYQTATILNDLTNLPQLTAWFTSGRAETFETVAFRSGAALTMLDQLVSDPRHGVLVKLLVNRLALKAATGPRNWKPGWCGKWISMTLTTWHQRGGRAGRMAICWPSGASFATELGVWLGAGLERARTHEPLAGCVVVLGAVLKTDDRAKRVACLLSDVVLTRALGWKTVLSISAQYLAKTALCDLIAEGQGHQPRSDRNRAEMQ